MDENTDAAACPEDADLLQLLRPLGFERWYGLLLDLSRRYDGWLADYAMDPDREPDYRPMGEIIQALLKFPKQSAGDDLALALALTECEFVSRTARDEENTALWWNPLAESYRQFTKAHRSDPQWSERSPWPAPVFAQWALSQLPPRSTPPANPASGNAGAAA